MANKEKFARVGAELRPEPPNEAGQRAAARARAERARGARSRAAKAGGSPDGSPSRRGAGATRKILAITWLGLAFMLLYALTVGLSLFRPGYSFLDRVGAAVLLFGLGFIIVHGLGYANSMIKANWGYQAARPPIFASFDSPRVACLIASFNEPPDVLEETISAVLALDYPNKEVIVLDDSTKDVSREAARELARHYGIKCVQRANRRGYKAGAINDFLPFIEAPYVAMFDADALPTPNFLRECIPQIHENPTLAFLQTPQFYANTQVSYVALASARQQNVFYECICEGKSVSRAAFCCGTNVIFRRAALQDVGGFDETNVVEDFATSFFLHCKGWDSLYVNRVYVYSLAPENLAAYFTQQSRWSFGTLGTARSFLKVFFQNPRAMSAGQWWEYFLSASYYWIGWVNFIFICLPLLYLFFDIKPLRQDAVTYLLVFVPYMLFTLNMFYSGMEARGYKLGEMVLGQQIGFISFPIHMGSAVSALLGRKRPFGVTPKGVGGRISWFSLWPQLLMLGLSLGGFLLGSYRYLAGLDRNSTAVIINSLWAFYHVWMLSSVFRLNRNVREGAQKWFFQDVTQKRRGEPLPALEGVKNPLSLRRIGVLSGVLTLGALGVLGFAVWNVLAWNAAPTVPVNVTILDRTLGRDGNQHRALVAMLNHLKIAKQPNFGPSGGSRQHYDAGLDYYGLVLNPKATPQPEKNGDLVVTGFDRPMPSRLAPPGAVYIADTFGQYSDFDASGRQVLVRDARRGLSVREIDALEAFARRGGLLMAEWNTLGFPTRSGNFLPPAQLEAAIRSQRARSARLSRETIPTLRAILRRLQEGGSYRRIGIARGRLEDARGALIDATYKLRGLQGVTVSNAIGARQAAAATRLEKLLRVSYRGWYGRFVENFAEEKQNDPALWKSVRADLKRRFPAQKAEPGGPGFVFYPDGNSRVFNAATGSFEINRFSRPIAFLGAELGAHLTGGLSVIEKTTEAKWADDPLLAGVENGVAARNWFDVVTPRAGARVLANYRLFVTLEAINRLRKAGFPDQCIGKDGKSLVFPALVAGRDGEASTGELRSVYLAGDASGYATVSEIVAKFPALGSLEAMASPRFGAFPAQYGWNFYEPVLRNALIGTPRLRYKR